MRRSQLVKEIVESLEFPSSETEFPSNPTTCCITIVSSLRDMYGLELCTRE
jgi:hypothetical protein